MTRPPIKFAVCVLFAVMVAATPIRAQDECRLTPDFALDMYFDAGGRAMAKASLEGREKYLVLDTGGYWSVLEAATIRELGLRMEAAPISVVGVLGHRSYTSATVETFSAGNMPSEPRMFMVDPNGAGTVSDLQPVGTLGQEFFLTHDADFDFAAGTLTLFSQEHCAGAVRERHPNTIAIIPFDLDDTRHIRFPITLDGMQLNAMLDTGASGSVLNLTVARDVFGIDVNAPDVVRTGELDGVRTVPTYRRRFGLLDMAGIVVENPEIEIIPDLMTSRAGVAAGESRETAPGFEIILGMSILNNLHIYVAYGERLLYISPANTAPG